MYLYPLPINQAEETAEVAAAVVAAAVVAAGGAGAVSFNFCRTQTIAGGSRQVGHVGQVRLFTSIRGHSGQRGASVSSQMLVSMPKYAMQAASRKTSTKPLGKKSMCPFHQQTKSNNNVTIPTNPRAPIPAYRNISLFSAYVSCRPIYYLLRIRFGYIHSRM